MIVPLRAISHIVAGDHPEQIERVKQFVIDKENTIKGCGMCSLVSFSSRFFPVHTLCLFTGTLTMAL
jgi:hypothetical protein